jgi:hypothetical protein
MWVSGQLHTRSALHLQIKVCDTHRIVAWKGPSVSVDILDNT